MMIKEILTLNLLVLTFDYNNISFSLIKLKKRLFNNEIL